MEEHDLDYVDKLKFLACHVPDTLLESVQLQLIVHTFPDFKTLVDKAITLENERRSLEDIRKRKRDKTILARSN